MPGRGVRDSGDQLELGPHPVPAGLHSAVLYHAGGLPVVGCAGSGLVPRLCLAVEPRGGRQDDRLLPRVLLGHPSPHDSGCVIGKGGGG